MSVPPFDFNQAALAYPLFQQTAIGSTGKCLDRDFQRCRAGSAHVDLENARWVGGVVLHARFSAGGIDLSFTTILLAALTTYPAVPLFLKAMAHRRRW